MLAAEKQRWKEGLSLRQVSEKKAEAANSCWWKEVFLELYRLKDGVEIMKKQMAKQKKSPLLSQRPTQCVTQRLSCSRFGLAFEDSG